MRSTVTLARLLSFLLLLSLAGIVTYWATRLLSPAVAVAPSGSIGDAGNNANIGTAATVFGLPGAAIAAAAPATNIEVIGIAAAGELGVAILSVDGKPAAPFPVGSKIDDATTVEAVGVETVVLERRGRKLELKSPARASLAVLSSGVGQARDPNRPVPPMPAAPAPPPAAPPAAPAAPGGRPPAQPPSAPTGQGPSGVLPGIPTPPPARPGANPQAGPSQGSGASTAAAQATVRAARDAQRAALAPIGGTSSGLVGPRGTVAGPNMSAGNPAFQNLR